MDAKYHALKYQQELEAQYQAKLAYAHAHPRKQTSGPAAAQHYGAGSPDMARVYREYPGAGQQVTEVRSGGPSHVGMRHETVAGTPSAPRVNRQSGGSATVLQGTGVTRSGATSAGRAVI
mmetsp:Transcript_19705/g.40004  ORF Transcript_19705/g.40004 Transcript_19705/m.40004 type:complete len:120 (+) Transcript_19705:246-605(+)